MSKLKHNIFLIGYALLSGIFALFIFMKVVIMVYDTKYGIQNHDNATTEVTEDDISRGNGISGVHVAEEMYLISLKDDDELDNNERALIFERLYSSDYAYKEGLVYYENAYLYTTKSGEYSLSNGVWHDVVRGNIKGDSGIEQIIGLVDLRACVLSGYGTEIYQSISENPNVSIRLDEYAKNGAIIYPLKITIFDGNHDEIKVVNCSNEEDISKYKIVKAEDDWLLCNSSILDAEMTLKYFEGINMSTGKANKYAHSIGNKLDYERSHCEKGLYHITRSRIVNYISYTNDNFGYVQVRMIVDPRIEVVTGVIIFIMWSINMITVIKQMQRKCQK